MLLHETRKDDRLRPPAVRDLPFYGELPRATRCWIPDLDDRVAASHFIGLIKIVGYDPHELSLCRGIERCTRPRVKRWVLLYQCVRSVSDEMANTGIDLLFAHVSRIWANADNRAAGQRQTGYKYKRGNFYHCPPGLHRRAFASGSPANAAGPWQGDRQAGSLAGHQLKQCLGMELPAFVAFYRSAQDFIGQDIFTLEVIGARGKSQIQRITVTVMKPGADQGI